MNRVNPIERFLRGHTYGARPGDSRQLARIRPFVTISRQAGAGGHTLARTLIKTFERQPDKELFGGWEMFDQKLVSMVADDPDLTVSIESLLGEEYHKTADDFFRQILSSTTHQDIIADRMFRLVRLLAEVGKAVIVGRAGSQVTRGLGPSISVRLVAPEDARLARMMELHGHNKKQALDTMSRRDAGRARLLKRHFRVNIDDPLLYDAIWNSGAVPPEAIADAIVAVLRDRAAEA